MDEHAADAEGLCGAGETHRGVTKERSSHPFALPTTIDRKPGEQGDRNRIGHVAPKAAGCDGQTDATCGERIIAEDRVFLANDKGSRRAADLIGASAAFQPIVERGASTIEGRNVVLVGERRGRRRCHEASQGAFVVSARRKRSFGRGGASSRARNSA